MARKVDEVWLFPVPTTVAGDVTITTPAFGVAAYSEVTAQAYRGPLPADCTITLSLQESADRQTWSDVFSGDPGEDQDVIFSGSLTGSWVCGRIVLDQTGTDFAVATCWMLLTLIKRIL